MLAALPGLSGCNAWQNMWGGGDAPEAQQAGAQQISEAQQQRLTEAQVAKESGDHDVALTIFQEILAENPTVTTAYLGIGDIYMVRKDYTKAEPAYSKAARLEPRNFDAQYGHGLALQMLERFIDAIRAYHRALTINPLSFSANLNMATSYLQIGDAESAVAFAQKAVELDPASGPARVQLGAVYEKVERNAEAIDEYLTATELIDEPSPELMMNLVTVLAKEKRYREAINTAETLVDIAPSANAYERLGWAYFRLAEYDRSIAAYRLGVEMDENHWPSLNGVGVNALNAWLLSKKRDKQAAGEAKDAFRASLRANPEQPKIIKLLTDYQL
jgi:tetratricopeptide (TPR) repeat protein